MPTPPQCTTCRHYSRTSYLVCAMHPSGPVVDPCPDFQADSNTAAVEQWEPVGAYHYGGEQIIDPPRTLTPEQQLALLDWHHQPWITMHRLQDILHDHQSPADPIWDLVAKYGVVTTPKPIRATIFWDGDLLKIQSPEFNLCIRWQAKSELARPRSAELE